MALGMHRLPKKYNASNCMHFTLNNDLYNKMDGASPTTDTNYRAPACCVAVECCQMKGGRQTVA